MKRIFKIWTKRCNYCKNFKVEDSFSSHIFMCKKHNHTSRSFSDYRSVVTAEKQIIKWFNECEV